MNARCDMIDSILLNAGNCHGSSADDCIQCEQYINCELAIAVILHINARQSDLELALPYGKMIYSEGENI